MTFVVSVRKAFSAVEKAQGSPGYAFLLAFVHIALWRCLYAVSAGLYFHKMYSRGVERYYIDLKMTCPPVPFQYYVSHILQKSAGNIFSCTS